MRNVETWMITMIASVMPVLANAVPQPMVSLTWLNRVPSIQFGTRLPQTELPAAGISTLVPQSGLFRILEETVTTPGAADAVLRASDGDPDKHTPVAPEEGGQFALKPSAATSDPQVRPVGNTRIEYRGKPRHKQRKMHRFHWRPLGTPQRWTNP